MTNHYYIYLGRENGKRVIHKVGQTRQTCYERCKNADYKIGCAFEIEFKKNLTDEVKKGLLTCIENIILGEFRSVYKVEHGREYFRTTKQNWDIVQPFFKEKMENFLDWQVKSINSMVIGYTYHEGWVAPNTY
jgi:hypothetical protein